MWSMPRSTKNYEFASSVYNQMTREKSLRYPKNLMRFNQGKQVSNDLRIWIAVF